MSIDVAVIGAGVSGLAVASALQRRGRRAVVLERQVGIGGKAVSELMGGFLMEHGPSSVNGTSAAGLHWSRALGLDDQRLELGTGVRRRYLVAKDGLKGIALHPLGFLTSSYLSWRGRLRLMAEFAVPRKRDIDEETVDQFCRRRFGPEFAERVMEPLVGGMLAGDARKLAAASVLPALTEMERTHGSILIAIARSRLRGGRMPGRRLFSWRTGVGALPRALATTLGPSVKTGVAVRRIQPLAAGFRVDCGTAGSLEASAVVIATQPGAAAALLDGIDSPAAAAAAAVEAPPLAVVFLGYARPQIAHPLDGLGYLSPRGKPRALIGALFCSTMFEERAPEGHLSLSGYLGGARAPDLATLPAEDVVALARYEFADLLGARGEPVVARVRHWARGLPQYHVGHDALIAAIGSLGERRPGLFVTGNYLNGVSVAACLAQADETARRAHHYLREIRPNRDVSRRTGPAADRGAVA